MLIFVECDLQLIAADMLFYVIRRVNAMQTKDIEMEIYSRDAIFPRIPTRVRADFHSHFSSVTKKTTQIVKC